MPKYMRQVTKVRRDRIYHDPTGFKKLPNQVDTWDSQTEVEWFAISEDSEGIETWTRLSTEVSEHFEKMWGE